MGFSLEPARMKLTGGRRQDALCQGWARASGCSLRALPLIWGITSEHLDRPEMRCVIINCVTTQTHREILEFLLIPSGD